VPVESFRTALCSIRHCGAPGPRRRSDATERVVVPVKMKLRSALCAGAMLWGSCRAHQPDVESQAGGDKHPYMTMSANGRRMVDIEKPFVAFSKASGRSVGWLAYALTRRIWIDGKFHERRPSEPTYRATFDEELEARDAAAGAWSEQKVKLTDPYFTDLEAVRAAGFLREYVWFCVPHPSWERPSNLRMSEFSVWLSKDLPNHKVETWVSVVHQPDGEHVVAGVEAHPPRACVIQPNEAPSERGDAG
jgi:hypothetical protein